MSYIIPPAPQGYDIEYFPRGDFGGYYGGAHYAFLYQGDGYGDSKIHAMKSTDGGVSWSEMDAAGAPTPPNPSGTFAGYSVSRQDNTTVHFIMVDVTSSTSPRTIGGFYLKAFDTSTDTWGATSSLLTSPALAFWGALGEPVCTVNIIVRAAGDCLLLFNGPTETVSGTAYGRVYVCTYDGMVTFGTPIMLPGQTGTSFNYTATKAVVDSSGITHFFLIRGPATLPATTGTGVLHVGMASGTPGTFGTVSTVSTAAFIDGSPSNVSEPSADVVSGTDKLSIVLLVTDPATTKLALSFFSATAALSPTFTADPGVIITEDPALVDPGGNVGSSVLNGINWFISYSPSGEYVFSLQVDNIPDPMQSYGGSLWQSISTDGGATWSTPAQVYLAPNIGMSAKVSTTQMFGYSFSGGAGIVGMFANFYTGSGSLALFSLAGGPGGLASYSF